MRAILDSIELRPKFCVWEITSRCNMRCLHCASNLNEAGWSRGQDLSLDEALKVCDDLAELGCRKIILSGGEALLRPDWELITARVVNRGIYASLISNGFLIDDGMAKRIREAGICRVAISIDGLEETHNYIRQNRASFSRAVEAIASVLLVGLPVNVVTHINRRNLAELPALERFVASCGVHIWRLQLGSPLGRLKQNPDLWIHPSDLPEVAGFIVAAKNRSAIEISVGDNIGYFSCHESELRRKPDVEGLDFWCGCSAGCLNVGIEANGNVKGCLSLQSDEFIEGNLRRESLRDIWTRPGAFAYTRSFEPALLSGNCQGCEFGEVCRGGCTFMAFAATGRVHDNPYCLHRVLVKQPDPILPPGE